MKDRILIVEDEPDMQELLVFNIENAGFTTRTATSGAEAVEKARQEPPALILLDLMLPGTDGVEVCKILKRDPVTATIPIIMLTAKNDVVDKILGLELGAEDYITKPFSPREVVLRIKTVLRRNKAPVAVGDIISGSGITLDRSRHEVTIDGKRVDLTATEFKLLTILLERRGRVQTRDRLLQDVWDYSASVDTRTVDTHVRRLRSKMGNSAAYIETIRGVGYRFLDKTV